MLVFICDASGYFFICPIERKSDNVETLDKLVKTLRAEEAILINEKVVHIIHSDNEPVFRSSAWEGTIQSLSLRESHTIPYTPWKNGVCERFMQSLGAGLRAMLISVDSSLWCYAAEYFGQIWIRRRSKTGVSPMERKIEYKRLREVSESMEKDWDRLEMDGPESENVGFSHASRVRRFGCLAYVVSEPRAEVGKLNPKRVATVFLGFAKKNSAWLFGRYIADERCRSGTRWAEIESQDATFVENILINDVKKLEQIAREGGITNQHMTGVVIPLVRELAWVALNGGRVLSVLATPCSRSCHVTDLRVA